MGITHGIEESVEHLMLAWSRAISPSRFADVYLLESAGMVRAIAVEAIWNPLGNDKR